MSFPFLKLALRNLFSKPSTVKFPIEPVEAKPGYRGWITYNAEVCLNCGQCTRVCSPGAITATKVPSEDGEGEYITYSFDMTSCTFCGTCMDFCNHHAINLTENYHIWSTDKNDLIVSGTRYRAKPKPPAPKPAAPKAADPAAEAPKAAAPAAAEAPKAESCEA